MGDLQKVYSEEVYVRVYQEVVKRIGRTTTLTITRMGEGDYAHYEPGEALDRLIVPIAGLFGQHLMHGILEDALGGVVSEDDLEDVIDELIS